MTIFKYECLNEQCGAQLTWDDAKRTQDVVYPQGKGPMERSFRQHDCPVAKGLVPPEIDRHPGAKKLA